MGVIFMMVGVGLHFSLRDLWAVRKVAIPGALLQTTLGTPAGALLTQLWGWLSALRSARSWPGSSSASRTSPIRSG